MQDFALLPRMTYLKRQQNLSYYLPNHVLSNVIMVPLTTFQELTDVSSFTIFHYYVDFRLFFVNYS